MSRQTRHRSRHSPRLHTPAERLAAIRNGLDPWVLSVAVLLVSALIFAGLVTRLLAVPVLAVALWKLLRSPLPGSVRLALVLLALIVALPLLQLVPLPPELWTRLPGREFVVAALDGLGQPLPWMPLSLSPPATTESATLLLPALAVFCSFLTLEARQQKQILVVFIVLTQLYVLVGIYQARTGPSSGFMLNKNHFAALLYSAVPIVLALGFGEQGGRSQSRMMKIGLSVLCLFLLVAGVFLSQSRAGMVLVVAAFLAALLLLTLLSRSAGGRMERLRVPAAFGLLVIFAIGSLWALSVNQSGLARFSMDPLDDLRVQIFRDGLNAARAAFPVGSGFGTFEYFFNLHRSLELEQIVRLNYAHNDFLQLMIEGGLPAFVLLALFVLWCLGRAVLTIRSGSRSRAQLAIAALVAILALLGQAGLEYHLRSTPVLVAFALYCGLLLPPRPREAGAAGTWTAPGSGPA